MLRGQAACSIDPAAGTANGKGQQGEALLPVHNSALRGRPSRTVSDIGAGDLIQAALYEVVNTRLAQGQRTVISSNLTMEAAAKRYSPAIVSRLEGEYHVLHFFGEDIRLLKKQQMI